MVPHLSQSTLSINWKVNSYFIIRRGWGGGVWGVGRLPPGWSLPEVFSPYTFCNLIGLEQWYFTLI